MEGHIFPIDEARSLLVSSQKLENNTLYHYFHIASALIPGYDSTMKANVFALLLDTVSKVANFLPSSIADPSFCYVIYVHSYPNLQLDPNVMFASTVITPQAARLDNDPKLPYLVLYFSLSYKRGEIRNLKRVEQRIQNDKPKKSKHKAQLEQALANEDVVSRADHQHSRQSLNLVMRHCGWNQFKNFFIRKVNFQSNLLRDSYLQLKHSILKKSD